MLESVKMALRNRIFGAGFEWKLSPAWNYLLRREVIRNMSHIIYCGAE